VETSDHGWDARRRSGYGRLPLCGTRQLPPEIERMLDVLESTLLGILGERQGVLCWRLLYNRQAHEGWELCRVGIRLFIVVDQLTDGQMWLSALTCLENIAWRDIRSLRRIVTSRLS
jgi:hypothetical protein